MLASYSGRGRGRERVEGYIQLEFHSDNCVGRGEGEGGGLDIIYAALKNLQY